MSTRGRSTSPRPLQDGDVEMETTISIEKPDAKVVIVTNLTRNVVQAHLQTIFGFYGEITKLDLPLFGRSGQNRGKAALEYSDSTSAHKAASHMDGGQLDGATLKVELSDLPIRSRSRTQSRPPLPRNRNGRGRSPSRSRSRSRTKSLSPRPYARRRDTYEPRYGSFRGGRFGARGGGRSARDTYRPSSRSRSPVRRADHYGPRRRSPSYERGGYGRRRRSRSGSYSVRSSRSRSRSYSRSRSRTRSGSYSSYSRYSRSRSRSRSFSRARRSHSRDDIRDSRSRSPRD